MKQRRYIILLIFIMILITNYLTPIQLLAARKSSTIKLSVDSPYIGVGDIFTVTKAVTPADTKFQKLTWSIENVSAKGTVIKYLSGDKFKAMKMGTATIVGHQKDTNKKYKLKVSVSEALPSFHIEHKGKKVSSVTTYPGHHILVKIKLDTLHDYRNYMDLPFSYSVADPKIAKVNRFGQVTGRKKGSTTLIAKAANGKTAKCKLVVSDIPDMVLDQMIAQGMPEPVGFGGYNTRYFLDDDYSSVDDTVLIVLPDNKLGVFNYIESEDSQKLNAFIYNQKYEVVATKSVELPYTDWGGITLGADGCYYVAVGQSNYEESDSKIVFAIIKYDKDFNELGRCNISDCYTVLPFYGSNCSMATSGNTLVLYTARGRYKDEYGVMHQSNIAIVIDTTDMTCLDTNAVTYNHVSHSFNQQVKYDKDNLVYIDHGDSYPRAIVSNTFLNFNANIQIPHHVGEVNIANLLRIKGGDGDNNTGTRVGGLEIGYYNNLVAGVSIPHDKLKGEIRNYEIMNIYLTLISKDGKTSKLKWLTNYKEGGDTFVFGLRMVKINDNRFGLLYQKYKGETGSIGFMLIDSEGNVLKKKEWKGTFMGSIQPVIYQDDIVWFATRENYKELYQNPKQYHNDIMRITLSKEDLE